MVVLDDTVNRSQTEPCPLALAFGGEKGVEYFFEISLRDATPGISDVDFQVLAGLDAKASGIACGLIQGDVSCIKPQLPPLWAWRGWH